MLKLKIAKKRCVFWIREDPTREQLSEQWRYEYFEQDESQPDLNNTKKQAVMQEEGT